MNESSDAEGRGPRQGPLAGVRVLDFTRHLAGPYATTIMGDFGADVIKIESSPDGDPARAIRAAGESPDTDGQAFIAYNHGKRSISLDLRTAEGVEIVGRLARTADVVIENYRPGVADAIGIGYDALRALNPRLVYCSVSAFGQAGPWSRQPATDPVIQAMSGVLWVTGNPGDPVRVGVPIGDVMGAMSSVQGVLMALLARERTGEGQWVDVSLLHALAFTHTTRLAELYSTGREPEGQGTAHSLVAPYEVFPTSDGQVIAGAWTEDTWPRFCDALGRPDLVDDPRFATNLLRLANRPALREVVTGIMQEATTASWEVEFFRAKALFGPVLSISEMLSQEQMAGRPAVVDLIRGDGREVSVPDSTSAIRMHGTPGKVALAPPLLSEHGREILAEAGLTDAEIDALGDRGVVRLPSPAGQLP